jgi:hypothetical protein
MYCLSVVIIYVSDRHQHNKQLFEGKRREAERNGLKDEYLDMGMEGWCSDISPFYFLHASVLH